MSGGVLKRTLYDGQLSQEEERDNPFDSKDDSVWVQQNFPDITNMINPLEVALDAAYLPTDMIPSDV
jgi:hypothetical protein